MQQKNRNSFKRTAMIIYCYIRLYCSKNSLKLLIPYIFTAVTLLAPLYTFFNAFYAIFIINTNATTIKLSVNWQILYIISSFLILFSVFSRSKKRNMRIVRTAAMGHWITHNVRDLLIQKSSVLTVITQEKMRIILTKINVELGKEYKTMFSSSIILCRPEKTASVSDSSIEEMHLESLVRVGPDADERSMQQEGRKDQIKYDTALSYVAHGNRFFMCGDVSLYREINNAFKTLRGEGDPQYFKSCLVVPIRAQRGDDLDIKGFLCLDSRHRLLRFEKEKKTYSESIESREPISVSDHGNSYALHCALMAADDFYSLFSCWALARRPYRRKVKG